MNTRRPTALAEYGKATGLAGTAPAEPLARPTSADLVRTPPPAEADSPLPLDGATLALSLPIAIALGQLNVPAAAGWAALLILYKAATAPGVARGTLDALVDGFNLDGDVRERLGVPPRAEQQRRRPASAWEAPVVAVRGWQAAVAARRGAGVAGQEAAGVLPPPPPGPPTGRGGQARTGTTTPLANLASVLGEGGPEEEAPPFAEAPLMLGEALARLPAVLPIRELPLDPRPLAVPLGMTPEGEVRWVDMGDDVVNVAVLGTTGAGKDHLISQWLMLLCRRNSPEEVQLIILDGKGDYLGPQFQGLAHLPFDPAGGYGNVAAIEASLAHIHAEARAREQTIFGSGHRSREDYVAATGQSMPLLLIVVSDLMTTIQGEVESQLAELISKARALGIRVIMSMQTPTGKDMAWRSNMSLVIAGCMVDGTQDAVALGIRRLQDMRYRPSQLPNPKRSDPRTKGLFVVRHGTEQLLVKAPFLEDRTLLGHIARLPRRPPSVAPQPAPPAPIGTRVVSRATVGPVPSPTSTPVLAGDVADELLAALLATPLKTNTPPPTPQPGSTVAGRPGTDAGSGDGGTHWTGTTFHDDGRTIHIHNVVAVRGGNTRHAQRGKRERRVNVTRMRERAARYRQIRDLVAAGQSANAIDRTVPGERKQILRLVRQAKAELGLTPSRSG